MREKSAARSGIPVRSPGLATMKCMAGAFSVGARELWEFGGVGVPPLFSGVKKVAVLGEGLLAMYSID